MKSEDLQRLIKTYVRQALNEALAEKYLQNIVKEAVCESLKVANLIKESRDVIDRDRESRTTVPPRSQKNAQEKSIQTESVMNNLGVRDPLMTEIFKDTLASKHPLLTGEETPVGEISEAVLEKVGVFDRDWSRFIK